MAAGINLCIIGLANDDYEPWLAHIEAGEPLAHFGGMSKDVIKLPVVLVVLVGSAFNVEIHKNAVQGIDRHWLRFGHLHFLPFICGAGRGAARKPMNNGTKCDKMRSATEPVR